MTCRVENTECAEILSTADDTVPSFSDYADYSHFVSFSKTLKNPLEF